MYYWDGGQIGGGGGQKSKYRYDILTQGSNYRTLYYIIYHRGEAMYISMIDFQWTSTETKNF